MANHIRQQIRERAGTVLTGLTTTGKMYLKLEYILYQIQTYQL